MKQLIPSITFLVLYVSTSAHSSTHFEYDERAKGLVNALAKCATEFREIFRIADQVTSAEFSAPRPADPRIAKETYTLKVASGTEEVGILRVTQTSEYPKFPKTLPVLVNYRCDIERP